MVAMVYVATNNESYAVEPDYYAKAQAWDDRRAQDRTNAELGWRLDFAVEPAPAGADPILRVELADRDGSAVTGARVAVDAFANVRRDEVIEATLLPTADGYEVALPMHRNGRWEFRFEVKRDQDVFTYRDTRHIWVRLDGAR